jgi:hypothetical protein
MFWGLLCLVTYLSVKPGSSVQEEIWLPTEWGLWLDIHDQWKNALGFGVLAGSAYLGWRSGWGPRSWPIRGRLALVAVLLITLIAVFEAIQLALPRRFADPRDIIAGGLGVLCAWGVRAKSCRFGSRIPQNSE